MSHGELIKMKKKSYTQIAHIDIKKALDFILSDHCVISTLYGVKEVILGGKERIFYQPCSVDSAGKISYENIRNIFKRMILITHLHELCIVF